MQPRLAKLRSSLHWCCRFYFYFRCQSFKLAVLPTISLLLATRPDLLHAQYHLADGLNVALWMVIVTPSA